MPKAPSAINAADGSGSDLLISVDGRDYRLRAMDTPARNEWLAVLKGATG